MSENTPTPEELVEEVSFTVEDSDVIPTPVDPTLSHEGEAADAKATGDAIEAVLGTLKVNDKTATASGGFKIITVYGTDIKVSSAEGAQTIAEALAAASSATANNIIYTTEPLETVAQALDRIFSTIDSELSEEDIDTIFDEVFGGDE